MNEDVARFLLSAAGGELLALAGSLNTSDAVRGLTRLRKTATPEQAAAAWEMADARRRAMAKFGDLAQAMYFSTEALEQASSAGASAYHARRMVDADVTRVLDLCGGIGADAIAFARAGLSVTMFEINPVRALFAAENARIAGVEDRMTVQCADVTPEGALDFDVGGGRVAAWFDPARRTENRRVHSPEQYHPPLSLLSSLLNCGIESVGVKLSPAIDHALADDYGAELEFLSDQGECKEGLLWTGALRRGNSVSATVISKGETHTLAADSEPLSADIRSSFGSLRRSHDPSSNESDFAGSYLYEPDPAVIRAHLVQPLGERLGASIIDPHIAYLMGPELVPTPFATAYRILDRFPYHLKNLQRALNERGVGRVIIKKRGFPQEPEQVRKQLKLDGTHEMIVVLTRVGLQHQVILCTPA